MTPRTLILLWSSAQRIASGVFLTLAFLAACPVSAQALDDPGQPLQTCTLMGCHSEYLLIVKAHDGSDLTTWPSLTVMFDGRKVRCPKPIRRNDATLDAGICGDFDEVSVELWDDDVVPCHMLRTCKHVIAIRVRGTPKRVRVDIEGKHREHAVFTPSYGTRTPNGPECPPTCMFARAVWTLKSAP